MRMRKKRIEMKPVMMKTRRGYSWSLSGMRNLASDQKQVSCSMISTTRMRTRTRTRARKKKRQKGRKTTQMIVKRK